ncbi:MAG: cytochrome b [Pseudomonadota bacterium]
MALRNDDAAWGLPARLLHWSMAVIMIGTLGLGAYTANIVTDVYEQFALVQIHKSWGFVVFALAIARVAWRLVNPTPKDPEGTPAWQAKASHRAHQALYVLMFALPITGWLMSSASTLQDLYGIKNMVFGLFAMPDPFVPGSDALEAVFSWAHTLCAVALTAILLVHAGAALKHHFIDRDGVLTRMVRGRPQEGSGEAGDAAMPKTG